MGYAEDLAQGYRGVTADPHPNADYTFAGAAAGDSPTAYEATTEWKLADLQAQIDALAAP
jgi:hypothetical protein